MDISIKKWGCSTCSKTFTSKACLRQHIFTHDHSAKVKCEICGNIMKNPPALSSHMWRLHRNRQRPSCVTCQRVFYNSQALQVHIDAVHSTSERPGFTCGFLGCRKTYVDKRHLFKHIQIEHAGNPVVRFPCTVSGKALKKKAHLESHILTHSTEKPFKCSKCGRGFAHKSALKRHGKVHLDKSTRELIRCQSCTRAYFTKDGLRHHIRIAHGNPQIYPCEFCDKRFSNSTDLKRHVDVIHSANKGKIYFCDKCKFSSRSEADLAAHHLSRHNDADGHECYFCGKQFFYFRQLVNHCSRAHTLEKFNCT